MRREGHTLITFPFLYNIPPIKIHTLIIPGSPNAPFSPSQRISPEPPCQFSRNSSPSFTARAGGWKQAPRATQELVELHLLSAGLRSHSKLNKSRLNNEVINIPRSKISDELDFVRMSGIFLKALFEFIRSCIIPQCLNL